MLTILITILVGAVMFVAGIEARRLPLFLEAESKKIKVKAVDLEARIVNLESDVKKDMQNYKIAVDNAAKAWVDSKLGTPESK